MHLALKPLATIDRPISVPIDTVATHEVAGPVTLVCVTVRVRELAIPTGLVASPCPTVGRPIRPLHRSLAMAHTTQPLASIHGSSRLILVSHPLIAIDEVSHIERTRIRSILAVLTPLRIDQLSHIDRLPILHLAEVQVRKLLIMLLLQT